jgi:hypothetical protein
VASPCSGVKAVEVGALDKEMLVVDLIEFLGGEAGKESLLGFALTLASSRLYSPYPLLYFNNDDYMYYHTVYATVAWVRYVYKVHYYCTGILSCICTHG